MKLAIAENYKKRKMEEGGNAYAKEDKEMLHSQVKQIKHHAEEMDSVIDKQKHIEPWVVSKMGRTTSDLSDVNHYLDGRLMKRGGSTEDFRVDGYMTLTNSGGIEIELDNRGDGLRYRFNNNGTYTEPEETFIGFDDEGEAMFMDGDTVYHLSDFMRAYAKGCMMKAGGRSSKMYYHILEYGDYGNIGYQGFYDTIEEAEKEALRLKDFFPQMDFQIFPSNSRKEPEITTMAKGGMLENKIDNLYKKSKFINDDFNWKLKLLEMLQDNSLEAYDIYQTLSEEEKEQVLQEQYEVDTDMGSDGDGKIETTKQNIRILLRGAKNGKRYKTGGEVGEGANIEIGDRVRFKKDKRDYNRRLYDGSFKVRSQGKQVSGFNGGYLLSNKDFEVGARKSEIEKHAKGSTVKGGAVGDDQLNLVFSRQDVFEKAKDFYENESAFYPSDVNNEFKTFVFDIENGEADATEFYLDQELQGTDLDGYYFEIADKKKQGGAVKGAKFKHHGKELEIQKVQDGAVYTTDGKQYSLKVLESLGITFNKERAKSNKPRGVRGERRNVMEGEVEELEYELEGYKQDLKQLNFDMELEAGEKGDKWTDADANRYGGEMNDLEEKIKTLENQIAEKEKKLSYKKGGPTKAQSKKVGKVMHEWKAGKLHSGSKKGPIVKDQKQAVAIALSEAGISKKEDGGGLKGEQKHKYLMDLTNDKVKELADKISARVSLIEEDPFVYSSHDGKLGIANDGIVYQEKHKKFIDDVLSEAGLSKKAEGGKLTGWKHKRKK